MFISERELREAFWKNYNRSGRAIRYQFEAPLREGAVDLVTLERFQGLYQINAFEFKLNDIKKAILQAKVNTSFSNKSWIVMPDEKERVIKERYITELNTIKYVGVIVVEEGGRWKMIHRPYFSDEVTINQKLLEFLVGI